MDKENFLAKIKEVGTIDDEVKRREILSELTDEVSKIYDTNESLTTTNNQYVADNETLRQANMKLFLRVGEKKDPNELEKDKGIEQPKEKRKFDDLFNEKGGIK